MTASINQSERSLIDRYQRFRTRRLRRLETLSAVRPLRWWVLSTLG
jgi:hypothetical protein